MATPHARPTPHRPAPTPKPAFVPPSTKAGTASIVGLVSFFRSETGEILYLHGVQFYLSRDPLVAATGAVRQVSKAQATSLKADHRGKIWTMIKAGKIASGTESDKFGRFKMESLPDGEYYLIGLGEEFGRYMVWQRRVQLSHGKQVRMYLNRNNLEILSN
jgi:hypothetical protein